MDVPAYLTALGLDAAALAAAPRDLALLERLHGAHVRTFPFSNVEVLLGAHPGVAPATVWDQLVVRRRGGYCFEHSQLFAAALERLGFTVRRALGRVRSLSSPRTHMTVLVDLGGVRHLCDPGFGFSITGPVELADGASRDEGGRAFTVGRLRDEGFPVWGLFRAGELEHALEESTVHPADVRMGHLMTSTGADSVFRHHLMVMRHTDEGHVTVTEQTVTVRSPGRPTRRRQVTPQEAVQTARDLGVHLRDAEAERLWGIVERLRAAAASSGRGGEPRADAGE
ncbi:arylamine N-acetyltransferase [Kocuria sp.]|uniref:arylamine N-acetyltransferase family protein n=1 Tax=Kocuria sp. TaxID=1871328 RepID=UPI0026DA8F7E|nr:arylamine N-acetyltransferase [Kocuria sp.]MDO4919846.1 arylamine N-acetyltransferase [Kocuria sp.]